LQYHLSDTVNAKITLSNRKTKLIGFSDPITWF